MSLTLSNVELQEIVQRWRSDIQPWADLANIKRYQLPNAVIPAGRRVFWNLNRFQSNYAVVSVGFVVAAILLSPILLLALALCLAACYAIMRRSKESHLTVMGQDITPTQQYMIVGVLAVPLLWLIGAISTVFWIIGISTFLALIHATLYNSDSEHKTTDVLVMEHV